MTSWKSNEMLKTEEITIRLAKVTILVSYMPTVDFCFGKCCWLTKAIELCTFNTHFVGTGLPNYLLLSVWLLKGYQEVMQQTPAGLEGVECCTTVVNTRQNRRIMNRCPKTNLGLNKNKCKVTLTDKIFWKSSSWELNAAWPLMLCPWSAGLSC